MKIKDLKIKDNKYQCPNCKEYELLEISLFDTSENKKISTGDYYCDNPDCEAEYSVNKYGDLLQTK